MTDDEAWRGVWYLARMTRLRLEVLEVARDVQRKRPRHHRSIRKWRVDAFDRDGAPLSPGEPLKIPLDLHVRGEGIAGALASAIGCTEASAFAWLTHGEEPRPPELVVEDPPFGGRLDQTWGMVTMHIPIEMPPSVVEKLYAISREAVIERIAGNAPTIVEGTPIAHKALHATVFAAERADSGLSWQQVFDEWSETANPKLAYANRSAFIDAVRKTYRRLLGRDLEWSRKPGQRREEDGDAE